MDKSDNNTESTFNYLDKYDSKDKMKKFDDDIIIDKYLMDSMLDKKIGDDSTNKFLIDEKSDENVSDDRTNKFLIDEKSDKFMAVENNDTKRDDSKSKKVKYLDFEKIKNEISYCSDARCETEKCHRNHIIEVLKKHMFDKEGDSTNKEYDQDKFIKFCLHVCYNSGYACQIFSECLIDLIKQTPLEYIGKFICEFIAHKNSMKDRSTLELVIDIVEIESLFDLFPDKEAYEIESIIGDLSYNICTSSKMFRMIADFIDYRNY